LPSDNWGWLARFGILVIDKDPVAEAEFWAIAPPGVTVHTARFASPRAAGSDSYGDDPARAVAGSPDIARGLDFLGQMELDAICVCFTTSSFFGGYGFDEKFVAEASAMAHGRPVTTAALAMTNAIRAAGIHRPLLVITPWFKESIVSASVRYFADAGLEMAGRLRFDLGPGWRDLEPWQIWDRGGQWVVRPEEVYHQVRRALPPGADGVIVPGSGFRSAESIALLERDLGLPVVTANQASVWECLRIAGTAAPVPGYGALLAGPSISARP
jgi:maleate isomerase